VERFTYKWHQKLENLELTLSAITPGMYPKIEMKNFSTTISSPKTGKRSTFCVWCYLLTVWFGLLLWVFLALADFLISIVPGLSHKLEKLPFWSLLLKQVKEKPKLVGCHCINKYFRWFLVYPREC